MWREIPGVTQVDEKGHEGNTAAVTAIYAGGNMIKERAGQEFLLITTSINIIYFEHYIVLVQQSCWVLPGTICFEHY